MTDRYITCSTKDHGFAGAFYQGDIYPGTCVIYAGRAGEDKKASLQAASFIREAGFNTLVLGWMGWEGTPSRMEKVPVDYVREAIRWLKEDRGISRIIMAGAAEGAVYTLLAAVYNKEIGAVCAVTPLDYVASAPSAGKRIEAVFTWQGKRISFVQHARAYFTPYELLRGALQDPDYGMGRLLRYANDQTRVRLVARIQVEKMQGDLLMIVPSYDDVWASEEAAVRIGKRLERMKYPYRVETAVLEGASHIMGGSYDMTAGNMQFYKRMLKAERVSPEACDRGRTDCLVRMVEFFRKEAR